MSGDLAEEGQSCACKKGRTNLAGWTPGEFLFLPRLVDFNTSRSAFMSAARHSQIVPQGHVHAFLFPKLTALTFYFNMCKNDSVIW